MSTSDSVLNQICSTKFAAQNYPNGWLDRKRGERTEHTTIVHAGSTRRHFSAPGSTRVDGFLLVPSSPLTFVIVSAMPKVNRKDVDMPLQEVASVAATTQLPDKPTFAALTVADQSGDKFELRRVRLRTLQHM